MFIAGYKIIRPRSAGTLHDLVIVGIILYDGQPFGRLNAIREAGEVFSKLFDIRLDPFELQPEKRAVSSKMPSDMSSLILPARARFRTRRGMPS
jgi:hypothetical protein